MTILGSRYGIRTLGPADLDAFLELVARNPVVNVFAEYRARTTRLEPRWLGGEMWGRWSDGELVAALHLGANVVPIECTEDDARAFAEHAGSRPRSMSTIVGEHDAVAAFWEVVQGSWNRPREFRWQQPHLEWRAPTDAGAVDTVAADESVRRTERSDLDVLYPACVAMYTEEVGVSPEIGSGADLYRARVLQLMSRGWSFARFDEGHVTFKAEVACASPTAAQIQGVWVRPERRGEGLSETGMAAVVELVRREIAPEVSLYLNEWNTPALKSYTRVGFVRTATFSTILF